MGALGRPSGSPVLRTNWPRARPGDSSRPRPLSQACPGLTHGARPRPGPTVGRCPDCSRGGTSWGPGESWFPGQHCSSDPQTQTRPLATLRGRGTGGPWVGAEGAGWAQNGREARGAAAEAAPGEAGGRLHQARRPECGVPGNPGKRSGSWSCGGGAGPTGATPTKAGHHAPHTFNGLIPTSPRSEGQRTHASRGGRMCAPLELQGRLTWHPQYASRLPAAGLPGLASRSPQSWPGKQRPFSPGAEGGPRGAALRRMGRPSPRGPTAPMLAGPATPLHARSSGHGTERLAERHRGPTARPGLRLSTDFTEAALPEAT